MTKHLSKQWTDAQVARLRSLATKVSIDQLVEELGRSRGAVTAKAFRFDSPWTLEKTRTGRKETYG